MWLRGLLFWWGGGRGPLGDPRVGITGVVFLLVDGGGCMERRDRFEAGREAIREVVEFMVERGVPVFVGIWWSEGLIPLCMGLR